MPGKEGSAQEKEQGPIGEHDAKDIERVQEGRAVGK
jgi:hypothetical protein